jgi:hypothetical protein
MNIALAQPDSGLPSILRLSARSFHPWFNRFLLRSRQQRDASGNSGTDDLSDHLPAARTTNSSRDG